MSVCEICGADSPAGALTCSKCGCSVGASLGGAIVGSTQPAPADFGFRLADTTAALFGEAEAMFLSSFSSANRAYELGYERGGVFENDDAFYFPVAWIGCSGYLVSKHPLRLVEFGSYVGPGAHIWAYYQGVRMEPLGKDRRNDLEILTINDRDNTVRVLKNFLDSRWLDSEVLPKLSSLPFKLEGVDLYFGIRDLLEAESANWFSFRISK